MKDLITEARELIEDLHDGRWEYERIDYCAYEKLVALCDALEKAEADLMRYRGAERDGRLLVLPCNEALELEFAIDLIPELCDALDKAEEQNKQLLHEVCKLECESVERDRALAKLEAEVKAVPVVYGRWVMDTDPDDGDCRCSNCHVCIDALHRRNHPTLKALGYKLHTFYKYCPNCGARMDGEP